MPVVSPKVLITDPVAACCIDIMREQKLEVFYKPKLPLEEILMEIPEYEILIVRSGTKVTKEVLNVANKLTLIGRAGTGVDNIDLEAATRKGIYVMNVPGGNTTSAAEHTCAMMITMTREIPQACNSVKSGKWERSSFLGNELKGKTLAIVGLGRVGREVATRMQAFGMKTIGYDPVVSRECTKKFGVVSMTLDELWPLADFITLHVPLDGETKHLLNDDVFEKCKQGVRIVNVARGGIIDEAALLKALQSKKCAGAALDVFAEEPPRDLSLIQHHKVICTPHLGANTQEAHIEVARLMALQIVDYVNHKGLTGVINANLPTTLLPENQPWVELSKSLGQLLAALVAKRGKDQFTVNVKLHGRPNIDRLTELVRVATLMGIMGYKLNQKCTIINSSLLAAENNIKIVVSVAPAEPVQYSFDEGMILGVSDDDECSESLVGFIRQRLPVLHSINSSIFESPVPLSHRLLIYSRDKTPDVVQVISGLMKNNFLVNAIYCSKPDNEWFVVSTSSDKKGALLEEVKPSVDTFMTPSQRSLTH